VLRHLSGRGVNFPEVFASAFRELRRLGQDAIEDVISGKFFCVGKDVHHAVAAAFGRPNGCLRRCFTARHCCMFVRKGRCVVLPTEVPAHQNQTAKQETSSIPIWNSAQDFHHGEPFLGQHSD